MVAIVLKGKETFVEKFTKRHEPHEQVGDSETALRYLIEGNKRYIEGRFAPRDTYARDREVLKEAQRPFAVVLTCSDSRDAPEIIFDQKLGDIFVIRNAGNIADVTALGSIEFAVGALKAPLVAVVGHSYCGAVLSALSGGLFTENLQTIIDAIRENVDGSGSDDDAIWANTRGVVRKIMGNSVVAESGAKVVGAFYDIVTGEVVFDKE